MPWSGSSAPLAVRKHLTALVGQLLGVSLQAVKRLAGVPGVGAKGLDVGFTGLHDARTVLVAHLHHLSSLRGGEKRSNSQQRRDPCAPLGPASIVILPPDGDTAQGAPNRPPQRASPVDLT
jgi:hypothetical protein